MSARRSATALLFMIAGLAVWGLAFNALYATQALGCAMGWDAMSVGPANLHRTTLAAVLAAFLTAHALVVLKARQRRAECPAEGGQRLATAVALSTAWAGLGATIVTGAPVLTLPLC